MSQRCIFCKEDSSWSSSIEHVVPESLGNKENILPIGVVCDKCNNYFARKVEQPVLDSGFFWSLRFAQTVPNKKRRVPAMDGIIVPDIPVQLVKSEDGPTIVRVDTSLWEEVVGLKRGLLIFPASGARPDAQLFSRFLAKVALEAVAQRLLQSGMSLDYLVDERSLDPIRNYARKGNLREPWTYHWRHIYDANHRHKDESGESYQILHEYDFLYTENQELYFIIIIFGDEYVINVGGPDIDGYKEWLRKNNNRCHLS